MKLDGRQVLRIAAEAACDPRTVRKFLAGETVKEMARVRIEAAMKALKIRR